MQSTPHIISLRSILILSSHLCLVSSKWSSSLGFPTKSVYTFSSLHTCPVTRPSHPPEATHYVIISSPLLRSPSQPQISLLAPHSATPSACVPPPVRQPDIQTVTQPHSQPQFLVPSDDYWVKDKAVAVRDMTADARGGGSTPLMSTSSLHGGELSVSHPGWFTLRALIH